MNFEGEGFGHSRSWDLSYNLVDGTPLELVVADPALSSRSMHEVRLVTADGRILLTQSTGLNEINTVLNRVLNQSPKGIYCLILQGQYESERFKILK